MTTSAIDELRGTSLAATLAAARARRVRRRAVAGSAIAAFTALIAALALPYLQPAPPRIVAPSPGPPRNSVTMVRTKSSSVTRISTASEPTILQREFTATAHVERIDSSEFARLRPDLELIIIGSNIVSL